MSHRCPHCRAGFEGKTTFFPFCSERCKLLDLGAWASERYSIPATQDTLTESTDDSLGEGAEAQATGDRRPNRSR